MDHPNNSFLDALDAPNRKRLPPLLRQAWYGLNQAFRRRIAHTQVTPDQFTALRTLLEKEEGGLTQRQLTNIMSSDPNTVGALLERMEAAGWIERVPDVSDRRALRISLLPPGKKKFLEVRKIAIQLQAEVLNALPVHKREEFLEHLTLLAAACTLAAENSKGAPK